MSDTTKIIFGICFIFFMTSLGSSLVFLFKNNIGEKTKKLIVGFSSGIMIAASIWSLLLPAIEGAENYGNFNFVPAVLGFLIGCFFIALIDYITNKFASRSIDNKTGYKKPSKFFLVMTLHNIPEGLAVGVAFGGAWVSSDPLAVTLALSLAVGIGVQNFPEGAAISLPMKVATGSKLKGFLFGVMSGIVEPVAAVIGFFLASGISCIMPWVLAFAAGAMIFVVVSELLPEMQTGEGVSLGIWGIVVGFTIMMALDVALG